MWVDEQANDSCFGQKFQKISSRFALSSVVNTLMPGAFPPGRLRLLLLLTGAAFAPIMTYRWYSLRG